MSDAMKVREMDLLDELPKLAPPDDLVADVELLALRELETSVDRWSAGKTRRLQTIASVPRYETAAHAMLVVAYAACAVQAGLRVLHRLIAG